jgi:hypothetical protein
MHREDTNVRELIGEMTMLMTAFAPALERCAAGIQASGKDPSLADKLTKGADVMRDSGHVYITWARHYAALAEGNPEPADDMDMDRAEFSL